MNPQDPLAELKPLREPAGIEWWPPAPGWWLLFLVALILLGALCWWMWRRRRANAYRRLALKQLSTLDAAAADEDQRRDYLTECNALLKSVAVKAYPGSNVAAASGNEWCEFLNNSMRGESRFPEEFASAPYLPHCPELDLAVIDDASRHWIRTHQVSR